MSSHARRRPTRSVRLEPKFLALVLPAALTVLGGPAVADTVAPKVTCASLWSLSIPNTEILNVVHKPADATGPARCNVIGVIDRRVSQQDPNHFTYGIAFSLNLPDAWSRRFQMMGNGGTAGSLNGDPAGGGGAELQQGWAVAANDGGHENGTYPGKPLAITWSDEDPNAGGTAHFGVDHRARVDFGYNAFARSTLVTQQIIKHYYGREPAYSYFWGCSDGGREAMMASQRFPDLFDGIVAANPGFNLPQAAIAEAWNSQALAPLATAVDPVSLQPNLSTTFPPQDLAVASAAILSACDELDGLVDGIIDNYAACTDKRVYRALDQYTCSPTGAHGNSPHAGFCLAAAQVGALKKIFAGPVNSRGKPLYGSWYWDAGIWDPPAAGFALGWAAWNVAIVPAPVNTAVNLTLGAGAVPMIFVTPPVVTPVNGPNGQQKFMFNFNFDTQAPLIFNKTSAYPKSSMEFMAAVSTDLKRFRARRGRMIITSPINDGIFSAVPLVDWYKEMDEEMHGRAEDFARLFLVPNMAHCGGGPATVPINNGQPNALLESITRWVERGIAPDKLIGRYSASPTSPFTGPNFDPRVAANFPAGPSGGTRPICPYPQQTRYKGGGVTNDAANFICVRPPQQHAHGHDRDGRDR
jgi:hypothetical protein